MRRAVSITSALVVSLGIGMGAASTAEGSAFPGRNGLVIFSATDNTGLSHLFTMPAAGGKARQVTTGSPSALNPSWSADGSTVVYVSAGARLSEIVVMDADGGNPVNLTRTYLSAAGVDVDDYLTYMTQAQDGSPSFSPDGTQIVFSSTRNGGYALYVMNTDGSGLQQISQAGKDPTWSPNGEWIAFSAGPNGGDQVSIPSLTSSEILAIRPDGTDLHPLTTTSDGNETSPSWSPDGQRIAYTSDESGSSQVHVMNIDGTGVRQLTQRGTNAYPAWSADGRYVYVTATSGGNTDIVRVTAGNGKIKNLTKRMSQRAFEPNSQPRPRG